MTYKVGVTGGIGSGKSLVCGLFSLLGVPVYNADLNARSLMENDPDLRNALVRAFGPDVYVQGHLDRKRLASLVFQDKKKLELLNSLVHPVVRKDAIQWFQNQSAPYAIKEAALIYETGGEKDLDAVIVVTAPLRLRLKRVHRRDGSSYREILARMKNQWPESEKISKADFVIRNNGLKSLVKQVWQIHQRLINAKSS